MGNLEVLKVGNVHDDFRPASDYLIARLVAPSLADRAGFFCEFDTRTNEYVLEDSEGVPYRTPSLAHVLARIVEYLDFSTCEYSEG